VIDDGSSDRTVEVARSCGVDHVVRSKRAYTSLLSRYGTVEQARSPFPSTMLLVRLT
jgi:hypothetical protein